MLQSLHTGKLDLGKHTLWLVELASMEYLKRVWYDRWSNIIVSLASFPPWKVN